MPQTETATEIETSHKPGYATSNHAPRRVLVDGKTLAEAYFRRVDVSGPETAYLIKRDGQYRSMVWSEVHAQVLGVAAALEKKGIAKGDRVCIMGQSRAEWTICDMAIMFSGAVTVPIYQSSSPEDIAFILDNCEAKLIFAEDGELVKKLAEAFKKNGRNLPVVTFTDGAATPGLEVSSLKTFAPALKDKAAEDSFRKKAMERKPDEMASIVYTSGTTGRPKGAVLTHGNFSAELRAIVTEIEVTTQDRTTTFLPFAHIFGRIESMLPIVGGLTLGFAEGINTVPQNILELRPTVMLSVPRIYEKIYAKIQSEVDSQPEMKRNIFRWAVTVGREVARLNSRKQPIPLVLGLKYRVAEKLVFQKIRAKLGGNLRFTVSGGAPLSPELCELFHACGIKILEGYGLTETTAAIAVNRPDDYVFGSVGKILGPTEIRIAEDGEIQTRGPMIFKEYFRNPEATSEVFTKDGWFATGDIGEFDNRGCLKITDRKKELIVTSGGKKIAPQKLENMLKGNRFISNGVIFGDKQKYLVALITLNEPEIASWAKGQGVTSTSPEELTRNQQVVDLIDLAVKGVNQQLASFESIKKFAILPNDFTVETGELTPSLKVKRKVVVDKYRSYLDSLY